MPHEHINSSLVDATLDPTAADPDHPDGIMRIPHRVTVIWNRPAAPHAYADPEDGYVQIVSEQLGSSARFPSPEMIKIDPNDVPDPRPAPRGVGSGNPTIPHFYAPTAGPDPDPDMDPCDFCGLGKHDSDAAHLVQRSAGSGFIEGAPTWSEPCTGLAVTLTRSDLNRFIKMLRRARDEAYGADA